MRFPGAVADIDSIYFPATTPEFLGYLRDQRSMRVPAGTDANGRKAFCQSGPAQKSHLSATLVTGLR